MTSTVDITALQLLPLLVAPLANKGAFAVGHIADHEIVLARLNEALSAKLFSVRRSRQHHLLAHSLHSPRAAQEFLAHADAQTRHVDQLAERIVQLGGTPDFAPAGLNVRGGDGQKDYGTLSSMIRDNLLAGGRMIEGYNSLIHYLNNQDAITQVLLENILATVEQHADELADTLVSSFQARLIRRSIILPSLEAVADHSRF
jgi:bacterioferritin